MEHAWLGYWGKTRTPYHLLPYHCLDVAAVGRVYLERHHRLRRFLVEALGLDEQTLLAWLSFFLALHDLGKFAESFQNQRPDLFQTLRGRDGRRHSAQRHDTLGYALWREGVREDLWQAGGDALGNEYVQEGLEYWARAVTGHHGQPPREPDSLATVREAFAPEDRAAALAFAATVRDLLLPRSLPPMADPERFYDASRRLSWWLAGLAVLADWLGSNTRYFDFEHRPMPLADYWRRARRLAAVAVRESGVVPERSAPLRALGDLFPALADATPLQGLAGTLELGEGPQLLVLEDVTGAGKTEAAVLLAHRLMAAGRAEGLYFALPTMATANAMYGRLEAVYRRLFTAQARPSLVLAHGARDLSRRFRQSLLAPGALEADYPGDEATAGARCSAWLADSRKKALLAQVGAGTLDQALLGVLYSRHQSLRLLGLFGKVLIVDEVHANDAYMHELLCALLAFHAAGGGSAVLLSATLPTKMRQALSDAFRQGLGLGKLRLRKTGAADYPLLTRIGATDDPIEEVTPTRSEVARSVVVEWRDDPRSIVQTLVQAARAGRCACWVRNTVADARAGYEALTVDFRAAGLAVDRLDLFHARYAMGDRLAIEERVLTHFGPASAGAGRRGRVLVATQVVEQSLDLDFDLLISDLAPVDLLIQRAGRLCRHTRDAAGNRLSGPGAWDQRGTPTLIVHGPRPRDDVPKNWYSAPFPGAARVYSNHARLWLTARLVLERGGFAMPEDARRLIEGVYGPQADPAPEALDDSDMRACGEDSSKAALGRNNALSLDGGYSRGGCDWWEDTLTITRLAEPETTLRLARWEDGELRPWCSGPQGWDLSQAKLRGVYAPAVPDDPSLAAALEQLLPTLPDRGRWSVPVVLMKDKTGLWRGKIMDLEGNILFFIYYDKILGLLRESDLEAEKGA